MKRRLLNVLIHGLPWQLLIIINPSLLKLQTVNRTIDVMGITSMVELKKSFTIKSFKNTPLNKDSQM